VLSVGSLVAGQCLLHAHDWKCLAVLERDIEAFTGAVAAGGVKGDAGQRRAHLEAGKASGDRRGFAGVEDRGADTAAGPLRVYEEGADLGRLGGWIEKLVLAVCVVVSAEERPAFAPAAAAGDRRIVGGLGDEVRAVSDQLRVDAEDRRQGALDLDRGVGCGPRPRSVV
jgi:hypothetical protein